MSERLKISDVANGQYVKLPLLLFNDELYKNNLSLSAKVIYAFLRDRLEMSIRNGWTDDNGDIYMYYEQMSLVDAVGISKNTVIRAFKELVAIGLIDTVRHGLGKPNRIYLRKLDCTFGTSIVPKCDFRSAKKGLLESNNATSEVPKRDSNQTNINQTNINQTNRTNDLVVVVKNARDNTTSENECQEESVKKCVAVYENNIRPIAGEIERDMVVELITSYGSEWFCAAVKEAVAHSARSVKYIAGVLENWKMHGRGGTRRQSAAKPTAAKTSSIQETYDDAKRLLKEWGYGE